TTLRSRTTAAVTVGRPFVLQINTEPFRHAEPCVIAGPAGIPGESPGGNRGDALQRFPAGPLVPLPRWELGPATRGLISADTRQDACAGQPLPVDSAVEKLGRGKRLLWTPVGKTCEFRSYRRRNGGPGWHAFTHRLWTKAYSGVLPSSPG